MRDRRRRRAAFLAILAGALLEAGHFNAVTHWLDFIELITRFIPMNPLLRGVFMVIILIASLGGIAVILGGLLILWRHALPARLLILFGTGFGLISFFVTIMLVIYRGDLPVLGSNVLIVLAVGMSVAARWLLREPRANRKRGRD